MRGFLSFIIRYHFAIIFIGLQLISFFLIVSYNNTQRAIFLNSSNSLSGNVNREVSDIQAYFSLEEENLKLKKENSLLRNKLLSNYKASNIRPKTIMDSLYIQRYSYVSSTIVQSSVHKTRNYITLDAGAAQEVKVGDGVTSIDGVVGVIKYVSKNFSVVLPLINEDFKLSCRINRSKYYGSLVWDLQSYKTAKLNDIPFHVDVKEGDTLYTTGFSSIFPTGERVGTISKVNQNPGDNFFDIKVDLSVDFNTLESVYILRNLQKNELDSLNTLIND
jgi:rod shape-determining protein MreC